MREWKRQQGAVSLLVEAGQAQIPKTGEWVKLGLPWGTKPRLILAHLNTEALKHQSPVIEVEGSLQCLREAHSSLQRRKGNSGVQRSAIAPFCCCCAACDNTMVKVSRSIPRLSVASHCGPNWTSGIASYGPRRSGFRMIISEVCKSMPYRSTKTTLQHWPILPSGARHLLLVGTAAPPG